MQNMSKIILLAGGTGGHLFPALALAQELTRRGHEIYLFSDERIEKFAKKFPAKSISIIPSATPSISNPLKFIKAGFVILAGILVSIQKLRQIKPDLVIGFGGYPIVPSFIGAKILGIKGILHEQNAVLGRANRALARIAKALALSFEFTSFAYNYSLMQIVTGNPVRDNVREIAKTLTYSPIKENGKIRLVIFGGSQGAQFFSQIIPKAIVQLPDNIKKRLEITQQCRAEDLPYVLKIYKKSKINADLAEFFDDLPQKLAHSHLIICRSGASSVAELAVLGRPAILIPLPGSLDGDQANNAAFLESNGAAWLVEQDNISPLSLAKQLEELLSEPEILSKAAQKAKLLGRENAVEKLADLAQNIIKSK